MSKTIMNYQKMPNAFQQYTLPRIYGGLNAVKEFKDMYLYTKKTLIITLRDDAKERKSLEREIKGCKDPLKIAELKGKISALKEQMTTSYQIYSNEIAGMNRGLHAFCRYLAAEPGSENIFAELRKDEKAAYYFRVATIKAFLPGLMESGELKSGSMMKPSLTVM